MIRQSVPHRWTVRVAVLCAVVLAPVLVVSSPALAEPDVSENDVDAELQSAIEEYLDAKETLETTDERQEEITDEISSSKKEVKTLSAEANDFAVSIYTSGGTTVSPAAVLSSGSTQSTVDRLSVIDYLGEQTGSKIKELVAARDDLQAEKEALEDEKDEAEDALDTLESSRDEAANAVAGQGGNSTTGPAAGDAPAAEPFTGDSGGCSEDDPTPADGCVTPRTLHAMQQAEIAGFQRYVSCYRGGGDGEHPQGRACDFSVEPDGFGGVAQGADRTYGDNLAAWFVDNADDLGVMYVIWYNQFWDPSQGWTSYTGGGGDPSSDHTNHVHVSMQ